MDEIRRLISIWLVTAAVHIRPVREEQDFVFLDNVETLARDDQAFNAEKLSK